VQSKLASGSSWVGAVRGGCVVVGLCVGVVWWLARTKLSSGVGGAAGGQW